MFTLKEHKETSVFTCDDRWFQKGGKTLQNQKQRGVTFSTACKLTPNLISGVLVSF